MDTSKKTRQMQVLYKRHQMAHVFRDGFQEAADVALLGERLKMRR